MGVSKQAAEIFSREVELYKKAHKFEYLSDAIQDIIENEFFITKDNVNVVTYENVGKLITKSLKEKLLIEYSKKNMIKKKYKKEYMELF